MLSRRPIRGATFFAWTDALIYPTLIRELMWNRPHRGVMLVENLSLHPNAPGD